MEVKTVTNEEGCHLVVSHKPHRDGHIYKNGKRLHRVVYKETYGEIPDGLVVRHKCDNPNCINPEHLELGTHADNVRDRVERNRSAKGSNNGRAKLTEDDVRYIRSGEITNKSELARMFKVDHKTIRQILKFEIWKEIS